MTTAVFFGDSITAGSGASTTENRWVNLVQASRYFDTATNSGIGGTVLQNTVKTGGAAETNNGRDTYASRVTAYNPNYVYIMYGLNDLRLNDANFSVANYQNDLGEVVAAIIANGTLAKNIVIGSPPYMNTSYYASYSPFDAGSTLKHAQYAAAAAAVASAYGTRYVDIYQIMLDGGGNSLVSADGIHPNDAGHLVIANAFLAADGLNILTLQPDSTAGVDTWLWTVNATTNYGTDQGLWAGALNGGSGGTTRALIKFDLSALPDSAAIIHAKIQLYVKAELSSNARTLRIYRQKRAWSESQATWNIYSTGNNWQAPGGFGSDDCEQTDIGSRAFSATESINAAILFFLTPTTKSGLDLGNGWMIKADTETNDAYNFGSSDDTTPARRPKLIILYTDNSIPVFMATYRRRRG